MPQERFEEMLTGGHPNSLGRTIEVVQLVVEDPKRFQELFNCYHSEDSVVRLRTSNALKRIEAERHELLVPYLDRLIDEIGELDQASAQWTLAQLFERLARDMTPVQRRRALEVMKRNLVQHDDWIVLNMTVKTLSSWAKKDPALKQWMKPRLERLTSDPRKSVAGGARKALRTLHPDKG
jgi:hypothetical protein